MSADKPQTMGWWMDERRGELGLTWDQVAERADVSPETLYRAGDGRPMRTTTRKGIERALQWKPGSVQLILDGEAPIPADEQAATGSSDDDLRVLADNLEDLEVQVRNAMAGIGEMRKRLNSLDQKDEQRRAL